MIKFAISLAVAMGIASFPIAIARLSSFFCKKCNDENWMSEGGCGHGGALWLMMGTIPAAIIAFVLMLTFSLVII